MKPLYIGLIVMAVVIVIVAVVVPCVLLIKPGSSTAIPTPTLNNTVFDQVAFPRFLYIPTLAQGSPLGIVDTVPTPSLLSSTVVVDLPIAAAVSPDQLRVYILGSSISQSPVSSVTNYAFVLDTTTLKVTGSIQIGPSTADCPSLSDPCVNFSNPINLTVQPGQEYLYVACLGEGKSVTPSGGIAIYSTPNNEFQKIITNDLVEIFAPTCVFFSRNGKRAYACNSTGTLSATIAVINTESQTLLTSIPILGVTQATYSPCISMDGNFIYTASSAAGSGPVKIIDTTTFAITNGPTIEGNVAAMCINQANNIMYIANQNAHMQVVNLETKTVQTVNISSSIDPLPDVWAIACDTKYIYISNANYPDLIVFDINTLTAGPAVKTKATKGNLVFNPLYLFT